jgi:hypothetical protein
MNLASGYLLSRTPKAEGEDRRAVSERMNVVRNLLLKYNPLLKKVELLKEEKKGLDIGIADLVSGGVLWGKRFVKWGLKDRYLHLVNLARELPESPVKDEILASMALFREVAGKLDNRLKELAAYS